eukprot:8437970-Alexandrium_andersonii.AAC.1
MGAGGSSDSAGLALVGRMLRARPGRSERSSAAAEAFVLQRPFARRLNVAAKTRISQGVERPLRAA